MTIAEAQSTTQDHQVTLTIDAATRSLLRREINSDAMDLEGFDHAIEDGDRSKGRSLIDLATELVQLLDVIGWDSDHNTQEHYEITVDRQSFRSWLLKHQEIILGQLGGDVVTLAQQERGEEDHYYCDHTQQESITLTRRQIDAARVSAEQLSELIRATSALEELPRDRRDGVADRA